MSSSRPAINVKTRLDELDDLALGHVIVTHADGSTTVYNPAAATDAARGTALAAAVAALTAGDSCKVSPHAYHVGSSGLLIPSGVNFEGSGYGTRLYFADALNASVALIGNADQASGNANIRIAGFRLDGNNTNNTSGTQKGVLLVKGVSCIVENNYIHHLGRGGTQSCIAISLQGVTDTIIRGNIMDDVVDGINTASALDPCYRLTIVGNIVLDTNRDFAFNLFNVHESTITANVVKRSTRTAYNLQACFDCVVSSNTCSETGSLHGIDINSTSAGNTVIGNMIRGVADNGINLASTAGNNNQIVFNNVYGSTIEGSDLAISGTPTGTQVYGNLQSNTSVGTAPTH